MMAPNAKRKILGHKIAPRKTKTEGSEAEMKTVHVVKVVELGEAESNEAGLEAGVLAPGESLGMLDGNRR
jgi:hypothetical protein